MVNYGASRGCETCRRRKKKCDEGRPTCERCRKAGISCLGYRSPDQLVFHHHVAPPIAPPVPISDIPSTDSAVKLFLEQYVAHPINGAISHGFLNGLPSLLFKPDLLGWARTQYTLLLESFPSLMQSCRSSGPTLKVLVTAILLGLYKVIITSGDYPIPEQSAHSQDFCAVLMGPNSCFNFFASVIWAPASSKSVKDLDPILAKCQSLLERATTILQDPLASWTDLHKAIAKAFTMKNQFSRWESAEKNTAWDLKVIGHITQADADASLCAYVAPGPVHSYSTSYTAAVMNTYRVTYLSLLDVLICLAPRCDFRNGQTLFKWENHAWILIGDMVALIPFHLANSPEEYVASAVSRTGQVPVGRHVGGLFLLNPLYVLSHTPLVPPYYQNYARGCLAWIGENMGIGLASVLSREKHDVSSQTMAGWQVLIWAGTMLQSGGDYQS
ncbi:Zn(II)2Cys6 transcription factor domain-containing protein [Aspergillus stella-maris]|uniref:Zn(II)2Cys6 transcription factor domain-containing protein n=1 Tax=Aspergillus stella-maris TaxID=1810926 RepID=UPI003CCE0617